MIWIRALLKSLRHPLRARLAFEALLLLLAARRTNRRRPPDPAIFKKSQDKNPTPAADCRQQVAAMVGAIEAADRIFATRFTCLDRAVATRRMLAKRRIPSHLRLAYRPETVGSVKLHAHCWLIWNSEIILGGGEPENEYRKFGA